MEPTLCAGDRVFADSSIAPQLGDLIVVQNPLDEVHILKRIVGVGGDVLVLNGRSLTRNGVETVGEPTECPRGLPQREPEDVCYASQVGSVSFKTMDGAHFLDRTETYTVPTGHLFLRGDHRDRSNDSTNPMIGTVPLSRVIGVVTTPIGCRSE